jgi:hypothetical protein
VQVTTLGVQHLAEQALLDDVQHHHFGPVVVAVLHHHGMARVLLGALDERPAIVERHGRRYFGGAMLACLHGGQHHRNVPLPRCCRKHQVQLLDFTEPLEIARAARIRRGQWMSGGSDLLLRPRGALLAHITDRGDPAPGDAQEVPEMRPALQPDADHADADSCDRRCRKWAGHALRRSVRALDIERKGRRSAHLQEVAPVQVAHRDLRHHSNRKPRIALDRAGSLLSGYDRL